MTAAATEELTTTAPTNVSSTLTQDTNGTEYVILAKDGDAHWYEVNNIVARDSHADKHPDYLATTHDGPS